MAEIAGGKRCIKKTLMSYGNPDKREVRIMEVNYAALVALSWEPCFVCVINIVF